MPDKSIPAKLIAAPTVAPTAVPIAALILAAGQSSRLGQPKQLVLLHGEPLLHRIARFALEAGCSPIVVVLGAAENACRKALSDLPALQLIANRNWPDGMSTSLRTGLSAIDPRHSVLVLVSDQLHLTAASLRRLISHHRASVPVTAAFYSGRLGVPAIFAPALRPDLIAIAGDKGARELLAACADRATSVDLPEAASDLDSPADLEAFISIS